MQVGGIEIEVGVTLALQRSVQDSLDLQIGQATEGNSSQLR